MLPPNLSLNADVMHVGSKFSCIAAS